MFETNNTASCGKSGKHIYSKKYLTGNISPPVLRGTIQTHYDAGTNNFDIFDNYLTWPILSSFWGQKYLLCMVQTKLYICWFWSISREGPNSTQSVGDVSPKLDKKGLDVLWVWSDKYLTNICNTFPSSLLKERKMVGAPVEQNDICIEGKALFHREGGLHTTNTHINSTRKSICHLNPRFLSPYFFWQYPA